MSVRLQTNFRARTDIVDAITPSVFKQLRVDSPAGEWKPAAWLPIQFTKSNRDAGTDYFVISHGKAVAFDSTGKIVPAGLRTALGGNGTSNAHTANVLTYTATDVAQGVVDLTTGEAVTAAVVYTGLQVARGLLERGLVNLADAAAASVANPPTSSAHVNAVIDLFISRPIGVAQDDVYKWSGRPEDGDQVFTNYSKQHLINFLTEVQLQLPLRAAGSETSDTFDAATLDGAGTETYTDGEFIAAGEFWDATNVASLNRYAAADVTASTPVVALGLSATKVAKNTTRTPVTCDRDGVLVRERSSVTDIKREGDWYLDADVGVLFLHTDTWDTLVALGSANTNFLYSFYTDTGLASAHRHPHFDGPCRPGDFVTVDAQSNYVVATAAEIAAGQVIVGRVLEVIRQPVALLSSVKTAWSGISGLGATNAMPGSASQGYTDLITHSNETVSDSVVVVNVRI